MDERTNEKGQTKLTRNYLSSNFFLSVIVLFCSVRSLLSTMTVTKWYRHHLFIYWPVTEDRSKLTKPKKKIHVYAECRHKCSFNNYFLIICCSIYLLPPRFINFATYKRFINFANSLVRPIWKELNCLTIFTNFDHFKQLMRNLLQAMLS